MKCKNKVVVDVRNDGSPVIGQCGTSWAGVIQLCSKCEEKYLKLYPQGWVNHPGDTCRHGTYVGGWGADYLCFWCEGGK